MLKIYENFLKRVIKKLETHFRKIHLLRLNVDMQCPNCKEWFSVSGIKHKHSTERKPEQDFTVCACGQCGFKSNWSANLIRVDENGLPISAS